MSGELMGGETKGFPNTSAVCSAAPQRNWSERVPDSKTLPELQLFHMIPVPSRFEEAFDRLGRCCLVHRCHP